MLTLLLFPPLINKGYSQYLVINLYSKSQEYFLNEGITIYGNLTYMGSKVYDGIVALQIIKPENKTMTIRVVSTGPTDPTKYLVRITQFYPSDSQGNPRTTPYRKGTFAYLTAYIVNNDVVAYPLYFAVNIYDQFGKPWAISISTGTIQPGENKFAIVGYPIPSDFPTGTAAAYAVALTAEPRNNGLPHCPEAKTTFQVESSEAKQIVTSTYKNGDFRLNISMPFNANPGIYTVYASSVYYYISAFNQLTYKIRVPDINNDGCVDIYDIIIVAVAFGSSEGSPNWNPTADINGDKTVDIYDLITVAANFGWEST